MSLTLLDYLDRLRRRPEGARRRIALAVALLLTLFILAIWLLNLHFTALPIGSAISFDQAQSAVGIIERIKSGWQVLIESL